MPEIPLSDLDPRIQKQLHTAEQSIAKGNPSYAVDLATNLLANYPECVEIRKLLRKGQLKQVASKAGGGKMLQGMTNAPFMMKANKQIKEDPMAAIDTAEKLLKVNPHNIQAHELLANAAEAADLMETCAFAYETIAQIDSKNQQHWITLGEIYLKLGRPDDAVRACDQILESNPGHGAATELVRRASVAKSMEKGYDKDGSFKDNLRDSDEAVSLELASRNVNDEETIHKLISEVYAKHEEQPENINHIRQLAELYRKIDDFENARSWISYARSLPTGQADASLENLESAYYIDQITAYITAQEEALQADPENAELIADIDATKASLTDYKVTLSKERVERYPNDFGYRFDYGELLFEQGSYDASLEQFQLAQRNPKVRNEAMHYMGRAFNATGKYDMAVDQLKALKGDLTLMDDLKKAAIYDLASSLENAGRTEEAITEYKEIYQNDIGYRDVSAKINAFYDSQ